jgi:hypothetical protein
MDDAMAKAAIHGATKPRFGEVTIRDRGRLPHWERDMGTYFVTFRLADSLPQTVLEKTIERHRVLESAKRSGLKLLSSQQTLVEAYSPKKIEEYLDRWQGRLLPARCANCRSYGDCAPLLGREEISADCLVHDAEPRARCASLVA